MNRILVPVSVSLVMSLGCGGELASPEKRDFDSDVRSPFRYQFFDDEAECDTGLQTFETLVAMCMHVQDPLRNRDCAEDARRMHFETHCAESGYSWFESFACDIRLVSQDTPLEYVFSETEVRSRTRVCAGYTTDAPDSAIAASERSVQVSDRTRMSILSRFTARVDDPTRSATDITVRLHDDEQDLVGPLTLRPSTVGGYWHVPVESAFLTYQCKETWACDDGR